MSLTHQPIKPLNRSFQLRQRRKAWLTIVIVPTGSRHRGATRCWAVSCPGAERRDTGRDRRLVPNPFIATLPNLKVPKHALVACGVKRNGFGGVHAIPHASRLRVTLDTPPAEKTSEAPTTAWHGEYTYTQGPNTRTKHESCAATPAVPRKVRMPVGLVVDRRGSGRTQA